jgi:hypothetical protein
MACSYAASQGWLIVRDDVLTLTTAGAGGGLGRPLNWRQMEDGSSAAMSDRLRMLVSRKWRSSQYCWREYFTPLAPWSWRAASTSAAPVLFAGMKVMAGAFGYLSQRLQMRDCGLFGWPRSHDPSLAIWLDGFNPIGAAEWSDPVGLHEVDIATIPSKAQRLPKVRPRWSCGLGGDHRALKVESSPHRYCARTVGMTVAGSVSPIVWKDGWRMAR